MEYVTSWERAGIEKGLEQGLERGRQEGRQEALKAMREILIDVLTARFGPLAEPVAARVRGIDSIEALRAMTA